MKSKWVQVLGVYGLLVAVFPAYAGGDPVAGKTKANQCAGCHGANGQGTGANPALAGKEAAYLAKQLQDYKSGARSHVMMNLMAKKLSDEDITDLAAYYAPLPGK